MIRFVHYAGESVTNKDLLTAPMLLYAPSNPMVTEAMQFQVFNPVICNLRVHVVSYFISELNC